MSWLHFMVDDMAIIEVYVILRCDIFIHVYLVIYSKT